MSSKTKFVIGGIAGAIIIVALFFIPANEFYGINSYNSESPPPIQVLNNYHEEFEINPIKCSAESEIVEFEFNVENKLDEEYRLKIHLVLIDKNNQPLSMEAILVEIGAGQSTTERHQTPFNPEMEMCSIELNSVEKLV